jgi:WD40 repeat protein
MGRRQSAVQSWAGSARRRSGLVGLLLWAAAATGVAQERPDIVWMQGGHAFAVHSVAVSPSGELIASAGADGTVKLWRMSDGALLRTLTGHDGDVNGVAFSPNGSLVASAGADGTVRVWRVQDGQLQHTLTHGGGIALSVAFAPNGQLLASGGEDGTVKLWRVATGAEERTIPAHELWVSSVAFSPSGGVLASASADGTVKLWQVANGQPVGDIQAHALWVTHIAFSPDGQLLASAGEDGTVKLWRVADGELTRTLNYSPDAPAFSVAFSSDGSQLAAGGGANYIRVWRVSDGTLQRTLTGHTAQVVSVVFAPSSPLLVSGGADSAIRVWQADTGALLRTLTGHTAQVASVAFSPDGSLLASGSGDSTVRIWRTADGGLQRTLIGHDAGITSVAFSSNGSLLASASEDGVVKLWRTVDGGLARTLTAHAGAVASVAFSPSGQLLATAGDDGTVKLWRVADAMLQRTINAHAGYVACVAFSPDGSLLATAGEDGAVKLWRVADWGLERTLTGHTAPVTAVAFSPNGRLIASGSADASVRLRYVSNGLQVATLIGHSDTVYAIAFSPDGGLLASGGGDGLINLWRISDGTRLRSYSEETGTGVLAIQFSPDGQLFGYGRLDATVVVARNPFPPNRPPAVPDLLEPADGATVSPTPTLRVRLSDPDGDQVQAVIEVYRGTDKVRTLETGFVASGSEASVSVDPSLTAGSYTWRARARDSAGNASEWSSARAFTVETPPNNRPPAVPELVAPADGATVSPTPTLRVRLSDPDGDQVQAVIEVYRGTDKVRTLETGLVASGSEASVSVDPSLTAGSYTWRARARDSAGNASEWSSARAFTVETPPNNRPPAVPELVAPADGATVSPTPTLRVRLSDPDGDQVQAVIEVYRGTDKVRTLETGLVASGSEASVSVDPPLAAGSYSWRARAKDSVGNTSDWSNPRAFTVQTPPNNRPPAVPELLEPADGATVSPTPTLRVRLSDPDNDQVQAVIEISDASGVVRTLETGFVASGSEASVSVDPSLTAGSYTWRARARDSAGNASEWSSARAFTVETPPNNRPPAVPELVAPADGATVSPTPTLRVRLSDPDGDQVQAVIEVRNGSGVVRTLETGFVASGSEASVSVDPSLTAGSYTWRARARDSAGNASEWSSARAFTVETPPNNRPPAVPELVAPADGATVSPTPTLRVRLSDPDGDQVQAVIEVYRGTDKVRTLETGFVASGSEASVSVDPSLEAGDYSWRARAKDSAGNASEWSAPRAFTVQTPPNNRPPAVPELVAPADGATVSPTPTLRVRLSDPDGDQVQAVIEVRNGSGVVRTLETGFVASGSEASVSVDPSLEAGDYSWRARAKDSAGNASEWSAPRAFTVQPPPNNRPPAVPELVAPADGATVSPTPTLRVRLSDPDGDQVQAVIEISDASGVVRTLETGFVASGSEASVSVDPSLEAGDYTWRARARDSAGNASEWSAPRAFTVQPPPNNRPPAVPELVAPADGATVSPTPTLRVRLSDPDNDQVQAVIEISDASGVVRTLGTGLVASGSEASVSVDPPLAAGSYSWRARAKDSAGNESDWTTPRRFSVAVNVPTRLVGIRTFALSLRTPTNDPNALGLNGVFIVRWDAAAQQYAQATQLRAGEAYFIKATNPVQPNLFGEPITGEITIPLKPGWNLIANPTLAPIEWRLDSVLVQRGSERRSLRAAQQAGWLDGYLWAWRQDPNNPMRGQYQFVYDASELQGVAGTLEPWQAYWILARVECTLVLNAAPSRAVQVPLAPSDSVWTLQVEAASARGSGVVWLGVAQGRSVQAMLAPEPPDGELPIQVRVRRVEGVFAADVRPTLTRDARWSLEVVVAPSDQPQPIRLRIHQATHLPRGVNLALVDEQSGARRPLRSAGASLTFTAPPEGGVFRFAIEPIARRTLLRVLNPTVRGGTRAGETLTLGFTLTAEAQVQVQIRTGSRTVRTLSDTRTRSAGLQEFVWDGRDDAGIHLPPGAYLAEITAVSADGQVARAVAPIIVRR